MEAGWLHLDVGSSSWEAEQVPRGLNCSPNRRCGFENVVDSFWSLSSALVDPEEAAAWVDEPLCMLCRASSLVKFFPVREDNAAESI